MKKLILLSLICFTGHLYSAAQNDPSFIEADKMNSAHIEQLIQALKPGIAIPVTSLSIYPRESPLQPPLGRIPITGYF